MVEPISGHSGTVSSGLFVAIAGQNGSVIRWRSTRSNLTDFEELDESRKFREYNQINKSSKSSRFNKSSKSSRFNKSSKVIQHSFGRLTQPCKIPPDSQRRKHIKQFSRLRSPHL
jgi:hypothetical protein